MFIIPKACIILIQDIYRFLHMQLILDFSTFQLIGNLYEFSSICGMATLQTTFIFEIVLIIFPLAVFQYILQSVGDENSIHSTYHGHYVFTFLLLTKEFCSSCQN
jgi:hypothetical protein